jgi:diguanylate cyclase (GGDEF)-like protein
MRLRFEHEAAQARRNPASFALLMMDMDSFKRINDSLGHKAGDDALHQVARVLSNEMRPNDFLSRYAGDEFVCLVQTGPTEARELVHRLQHAVDNTRIDVDGSDAGLGISIGWASFGVDGETIDEMLLAADRTMYADKLRRRPVLSASSDLEQLQVDQSRVM